MASRTAKAVMAVAALAGTMTTVGCAESAPSNAAPPLRVCGTTLSDSPGGPVLTDATRGPVTVRDNTVGTAIYLQVSSDCEHGAAVSYDPADAAVVTSAEAKDGLLAALVIRPISTSFDVTVAAQGRTPCVVKVRLARAH